MSLPLINPIALSTLLDRHPTTCIGSPAPGHDCCSNLVQSLTRKYKNAKTSLPELIATLETGVTAVSAANIRSLQSIAEAFTCNSHIQGSRDFAYHWLASSLLDDFFAHMRWSRIATEWTCLASGATVCNTKFDGTSSIDIYRTFYAALTRLAVGVRKSMSVLENIARHWLCKDHQTEIKKQLETSRQRCERYWIEVKIPHIQWPSSPDAKKRRLHSQNDYSQADGILEQLGGPEDIEAIQRGDQDWTPATPCKPRSTGATRRPEEKSQGDEETATQPESLTIPSLHHIPTEVPNSPGSSIMQTKLNVQQRYGMPGLLPIENHITIEEAAPRISETSSKTISPKFEPCVSVDHNTVFDNVFKLLEKRLPPRAGETKDGYIYVFRSRQSAKHVKIGLTIRRIEERKMEIVRCAGAIDAVKAKYNVCSVPHHEWLETTIFESLRSWRTGFRCPLHGKDCDKLTKHHEWFEVPEDVNEFAEYIEQWRDWMRSNPYNVNGFLQPKWQRRIDFFHTHNSRFNYLLDEPSPCRAWSIFLNPPWPIRIRMVIYDVRKNWKEILWIAADWSAKCITLLLYVGCPWVLHPLALRSMFAIVLCALIWLRV